MSGGAIVSRLTRELDAKDKLVNQLQQVLRNQSSSLFQYEHREIMVALTAGSLASGFDPATAVSRASDSMEILKGHYAMMAESNAKAPTKKECCAKPKESDAA
jgi:hypothetical protein